MTKESQNNQLNQQFTEFSTSDERYLRQAIVLSQQAGARGNRPFGAVIADAHGELVAQAENDTITAHDCTGHAETNALRIACGKLDRAALAGCTLYASGEPCVMCAGAIMHARVARVVFGARDPKTGACGSVVDLFAEQRLNHHAEVTSGVLAGECGTMLSAFFAARRRRESQPGQDLAKD